MVDGVEDLESISVHSSSLEGTLPTELGFLSLQSLAMSSYRLSGTLPTELALMTTHRIHVPGSAISGHLPHQWPELLGGVFVGQNRLSGTIPTELGAIGSLDAIMMEMNSISGTMVR